MPAILLFLFTESISIGFQLSEQFGKADEEFGKRILRTLSEMGNHTAKFLQENMSKVQILQLYNNCLET